MKNKEIFKKQSQKRRHNRVRSKIFGTAEIPRLSVFRSNKGIFVQIINDDLGVTMASESEKSVKDSKTKVDIAKEVGKLIAQKAQEKNITKVVFDRGGYKYHGRIKAVAEGARESGLIF
ncbi:MAG: 50S ribosomal protein L18 [Candidatus Pacebacteria bacterium]|nr:50S ribosomal protein L18 [Candidatus Paceibacterota bacterium]